ncbi:MAG: hypothetical protein AB7S75_21295 [Desulfococcaceae bacterium]
MNKNRLSESCHLLHRIRIPAILCLLVLCFSGCTGTAPRNPGNLCAIFREKPEWYESASASCGKWGIPIPVMMAIMYRESDFRSDARPRRTCLFIFPGLRRSTAYGYSQAIDSTWNIYCKHTGRLHADREDFDDAIDFIGWYCNISFVKCGIAKHDAYNLYLAYHEGQNGFNQGSYNKKNWLKKVALSVREQAETYTLQFGLCESEFRKPAVKGKSCLYPF